MPSSSAGLLLLFAVAAAILPPGYPAYIGAYLALGGALAALLAYGWRERAVWGHPVSVAILAALALVSVVIPFVYRGPTDLQAPLLILPTLAAIGLGALARPARLAPSPATFATICLAAAFIALAAGAYEHFLLGVYRPGLGNNPIHYGSLAALAGGLALVGVVARTSPWRFFYLLGPVFGLGAAGVSDSRGPILGSIIITIAALVPLTIWLWRERVFRLAMLATTLVAAAGVAYLVGSGNARIAGVIDSGLQIFRLTGGPDDIRAALYLSAVEILKTSPLVGVGLGQIMATAETMFPDLVPAYALNDLHADWANFIAIAGGTGLLAYLLLLTAPMLLLIDPTARRDRPVVLGAVILTVGQLALGASNATFGILPQTTIFAISLGYFLARARGLLTARPLADRRD